MPNWKDEIKAEIEDLQGHLEVRTNIDNTAKHVAELCALILELIDHIPDEKPTHE